jgi:hypothetical protein
MFCFSSEDHTPPQKPPPVIVTTTTPPAAAVTNTPPQTTNASSSPDNAAPTLAPQQNLIDFNGMQYAIINVNGKNELVQVRPPQSQGKMQPPPPATQPQMPSVQPVVQIQSQGQMPATPPQIQSQGPMQPQIAPQGPMQPQIQSQGPMQPQIQSQGPMQPQIQSQGPIQGQPPASPFIPQHTMQAYSDQLHAQLPPFGAAFPSSMYTAPPNFGCYTTQPSQYFPAPNLVQPRIALPTPPPIPQNAPPNLLNKPPLLPEIDSSPVKNETKEIAPNTPKTPSPEKASPAKPEKPEEPENKPIETENETHIEVEVKNNPDSPDKSKSDPPPSFDAPPSSSVTPTLEPSSGKPSTSDSPKEVVSIMIGQSSYLCRLLDFRIGEIFDKSEKKIVLLKNDSVTKCPILFKRKVSGNLQLHGWSSAANEIVTQQDQLDTNK